MNNLDRPVNITNGPKGITGIDPVSFFGFDLSKTHSLFGFTFPSVYMYYYLFVTVFAVRDLRVRTLAAFAYWPRVGRDPRRRNRRQGDGHQHP